MYQLHEQDIQCPYCGERIAVLIDESVGDQAYTEDCQVCCRPIEIRVSFDWQGDLAVRAQRDDD